MAFRQKIFLAMLALVAGVTGVSFWLAERSIRGSFDAVQAAQFSEREDSLLEMRAARVREARRIAAAYAQNVRVLAAFLAYRDAPDAESAENLYDMAGAELLKPGVATKGWRLAFFDVKGNAIPGAQKLPEATHLNWAPSPDAMRQSLASKSEPSGLISPPDGGGLAECVVARIDDAVEGPLGIVLLAARLPETAAMSSGGMRLGFFMDGRLHGDGWPADVGGRLPKWIASGQDGEMRIGTELHRVFVRPMTAGDAAGFFPACWQVAAVSLEPSLQEQRSLRWKLLLAGAAAIPLALIAAGFLSSGLAAPVKELVAATQRIAAGDYVTPTKVTNSAELGQLAAAFNEMSKGLAQKETYRSLLDVVSDPSVAATLLDRGLELGGEDRDVSVIFCDICGFTKLSENRAPREVIALLNEHFTPLTQIIARHGGVVLHFVGDMVIGLFGAPADMADHPRRAAACALEMIRERAKLNETAALPIEMSIGVASGHVVAGRMGSRDRLIYSVIGARVNLASRLCSQAAARQVIVDQETLARLGPGTKTRAIGEVSLKGFSANAAIYELLAVEDIAAQNITTTHS